MVLESYDLADLDEEMGNWQFYLISGFTAFSLN